MGNPLNARYPTPDRSTQLAEFPDRSLAEIPHGPFPQQIIEETEEDLNGFAKILEGLGITVKRPDTWPHDGKFSTIHWEAQGYYNYCPRDVLLVIGDHIMKRQCHPQPRPGNVRLSHIADGVYEVRRKVVQRSQAHTLGLTLRGG